MVRLSHSIFRSILLFTCCFFLWTCNNVEKKQEIGNKRHHSALGLSFVTEKISESLGCDPGQKHCTYISVEFPHFTTGKNHQLINKHIRRKICHDLGGGKSYVRCDLDSLMEGFINEYKQFKSAFPDTKQHWYFSEKISINRLTKSFLCMTIEQNTYRGGAHGLSTRHYLNFNIADGSKLKLADILKENYQQALPDLLNRAFEQQVAQPADSGNITATTAFKELPEPSENFALTDEGLLFHYNPYELGPYSAGSMELLISYQEASEILQEHVKQ